MASLTQAWSGKLKERAFFFDRDRSSRPLNERPILMVSCPVADGVLSTRNTHKAAGPPTSHLQRAAFRAPRPGKLNPPCYGHVIPHLDCLLVGETPYGLAHAVAAILADLPAPGTLTALPDDGFEHVLSFRPSPGVRLRRVCLLASDISRELDAAYVRIEQLGATAELRIRLLCEVPCDW